MNFINKFVKYYIKYKKEEDHKNPYRRRRGAKNQGIKRDKEG